MKHRWIPVAVVLWMLGMLWLAGVGPVGARSESDDLAAQVEPELVVRPPTAWHDPICAGSKERYTLSFTNDSPETLTNVLVKDTLPEICPEGCDVCAWNDNDWPDDDCSPGATYDGQRTVSWQFASVAPGETVTLHIEVRFWSHIPDGQVLRNCLTVTSDQLGPESACTDVVVIQCETPTPPPTITPTHTPEPPPTATPTATPEPTATPTSTTPPVYKLYLPDIYANHIVVPPTPTPTPTATATPAVPIVQCYASEPGVGIIYRVDDSLFRGYAPGASAGQHPLNPITSPPAPAGWNQPAFVTDSSWRTPDQVWWPAWAMGTWVIDFPDATIIGLENSKGKAEGVDGTTHLIRQTFDLVPPEPGRHITSAVLSMWSDNKTAWWWEGDLVMNDRQQNVGQVQLFPAHVAPEGGTYLLAIQNSNDYMLVENPQGTAYRLCVTWAR